MDATVDRNATTEESEQGTTESFYNKTTEEVGHRITVKYNTDLRTEISSRFPTNAIEKHVGEEFVFGRANGSDILLNDSKMPRTFMTIVTRANEGGGCGVDFFLKNCTGKIRIPLKNHHQKDTQYIGMNEEKELQNGTKFNLRDVKFTFYVEYGDTDSTKVELEVTKSDDPGAETDPSWYEQIGSSRPPGRVGPTTTALTQTNTQHNQVGLVFPAAMSPGQIHPQPLAHGHSQTNGTPCYNNQCFHQQPMCQVMNPACVPAVVPGQYPCQPPPFVSPVVYGNTVYGTESSHDKCKSTFSPSPSAEVGLCFPYPQSTILYDTQQHPPPMKEFNQSDRPNVEIHNGVHYGMAESPSQARHMLANNIPNQGLHCFQQTISHPGPWNYLGTIPINQVPRGPPLDSLGSLPDCVSEFSAMRLQSPDNTPQVDTSGCPSSASRREPTEHEDRKSVQ